MLFSCVERTNKKKNKLSAFVAIFLAIPIHCLLTHSCHAEFHLSLGWQSLIFSTQFYHWQDLTALLHLPWEIRIRKILNGNITDLN